MCLGLVTLLEPFTMLSAGSISIIAEEDDHRELVPGYFGAGEFVGEMGLFIESDAREVILRTRTQ